MTKIEWVRNRDGGLGQTWNPTVGCSRVSPGCDGCYAIGVAHRAMQPAHEGLTAVVDGRVDWTGEVRVLPERLVIPLAVRKPTTWFVDSMSDLFHPEVTSRFIARVFGVMAATPQHTYQVLTKRPQRMEELLTNEVMVAYVQQEFIVRGGERSMFGMGWPLPNVHIGTSIESARYLFRADNLRQTPAALRFLSLEPLLGPLGELDLFAIDWVIVGGESGPKARPMDLDWAREIVAQCRAAGVPVFVKQLGSAFGPHKGGDMDAWPEDLRVREMPA